MITLTEKAAKQLKTILVDQGAPGKFVRVYVESGGCCSGPKYGLGFDEKQDDDAVVKHDGVEVIVDPESASVLEGSVIDYIDTPRGKGFQIKNPNERPHQHEGGCGSEGCGCSH